MGFELGTSQTSGRVQPARLETAYVYIRLPVYLNTSSGPNLPIVFFLCLADKSTRDRCDTATETPQSKRAGAVYEEAWEIQVGSGMLLGISI
jgi:hypothetical protein